jgi:hypothetical protein
VKIGDRVSQLISIHAFSGTGAPNIRSEARNQKKEDAENQMAFPELQLLKPQGYS